MALTGSVAIPVGRKIERLALLHSELGAGEIEQVPSRIVLYQGVNPQPVKTIQSVNIKAVKKKIIPVLVGVGAMKGKPDDQPSHAARCEEDLDQVPPQHQAPEVELCGGGSPGGAHIQDDGKAQLFCWWHAHLGAGSTIGECVYYCQEQVTLLLKNGGSDSTRTGSLTLR